MAGTDVARRRDRWVNAWIIERLDQLLFDIKSVGGRYVTECLKAAEQFPEQRTEWEAAAQRGEAAFREMADRCESLFWRYGKEHKELE